MGPIYLFISDSSDTLNINVLVLHNDSWLSDYKTPKIKINPFREDQVTEERTFS